MTTRKVLGVFFLGIVLLLFLFAPAAAEPQKQWVTLVTGVSAAGIPVQTQVFGYYANVEGYGQVFIICDPATGSETGYAYVPGVKVGEKKGQKIKGYKRGIIEDWTVVKRIDPATLRIIAPNVFVSLGYTDYSWEQYSRTGKLLRTAYGPATWPGPEGGYLIPGSDPDYWLIVAEVTNPNDWPVKVRIFASIDRWRESWSLGSGGPALSVDKEVILGANQTKYVLVNQGKPSNYYILADNRDWISDRQGCDVWTDIYFSTKITENRDPELPDYLKPNKGYIDFTDVWGGPPEPKDLSQGFTVAFRVSCAPANSSSWYFEGTVSLVANEWGEASWVAYPGNRSRNPQTAKQEVEKFFSSHWPSRIPSVDPHEGSEIVDGIKFYDCWSTGAEILSGPEMIGSGYTGPALADYTAPVDIVDLNESIPEIVSSSGNEIPVLKYRPVFVEFCRFIPGYSADEGWLYKEVVPGFNVRASSISRPYFSVSDSLINYTVNYVRNGSGKNTTRYWEITINHYVTIRAVNPGTEAGVTFSGVSLALPNLYYAINRLESNLEDRIDADVEIANPNYKSRYYDPVFMSPGTVSLAPGENRVIYSGNVTTKILIRDPAISFDYDPWGDQYLPDYYVYIDRSDVESAVNSVLGYFYWSGDAAFVGYFTVTVTPRTDVAEQVFSLNRACYRDDDEDYYREVGVIGEVRNWLRPVSYFGDDGQSMRPVDALYSQLLQQKVLMSTIGYEDGRNFWTVMISNSSGWRIIHRIGEN